jgi:hypothetical protein
MYTITLLRAHSCFATTMDKAECRRVLHGTSAGVQEIWAFSELLLSGDSNTLAISLQTRPMSLIYLRMHFGFFSSADELTQNLYATSSALGDVCSAPISHYSGGSYSRQRRSEHRDRIYSEVGTWVIRSNRRLIERKGRTRYKEMAQPCAPLGDKFTQPDGAPTATWEKLPPYQALAMCELPFIADYGTVYVGIWRRCVDRLIGSSIPTVPVVLLRTPALFS